MIRTLIPATIIAFASCLPAQAEQFAVQLDGTYDGANVKLLETLKISEIESFSENGVHYVVLEAPNDGYVEAFVLAIGRNAVALNILEANWNNPVMKRLPIAQRLGFLRAIECEFCTS